MQKIPVGQPFLVVIGIIPMRNEAVGRPFLVVLGIIPLFELKKMDKQECLSYYPNGNEP
jgi:hypothetical protein